MKKELIVWVCALLVVPFLNAGCQNVQTAAVVDKDVEISPSVLKVAEWAGFKYLEVLGKAKTGESKSLRQFLEFHGTTDGTDALSHAVTCLELIPIAGDYPYANAIIMCKPTLRKILLERLVLAQGRTKKPELQQPMAQWAPNVWAALHGQPLPNIPAGDLFKSGDAQNGGATGEAASSGRGAEASPADSTAPTVQPGLKPQASPQTAPKPAPGSTPPAAPKPAPGATPQQGGQAPRQ